MQQRLNPNHNYKIGDDFTHGYCFQKAIAVNTNSSLADAKVWEIYKFDPKEILSFVADLIPVIGNFVSFFVDEQLDFIRILTAKINANTNKMAFLSVPRSHPGSSAFYKGFYDAELQMTTSEIGRSIRRVISSAAIVLAFIPGKKIFFKKAISEIKNHALNIILSNPTLARKFATAAASTSELNDILKQALLKALAMIPNIQSKIDEIMPRIEPFRDLFGNMLRSFNAIHYSQKSGLPYSSVDKLLKIDDDALKGKVDEFLLALSKYCRAAGDCSADSKSYYDEFESWLAALSPDESLNSAEIGKVSRCLVH